MQTIRQHPLPRKALPPAPAVRWAWERDQKLRALGFSSYADYIASPVWVATRSRYRASDLPQDCQLCGADEIIQLHHRTYERVGEELLTDLVPLCPTCHVLVHTLRKRGDLEDFDLEQIRVLVDADRAEANREKAEEIRPDFLPRESGDSHHARAKTLVRRLTRALDAAAKKGHDITPSIAMLEALTVRVEHPNRSDPSKRGRNEFVALDEAEQTRQVKRRINSIAQAVRSRRPGRVGARLGDTLKELNATGVDLTRLIRVLEELITDEPQLRRRD